MVLLIPLLALLSLSVVVDYRTALRLANDAYDHALLGSAIALVSRLERTDSDTLVEVDLPPAADAILRFDPYDRVYYAVVNRQGRLIAGDAALLPLAAGAEAGPPRFADVRIGGDAVRAVALGYASEKIQAAVVVAETAHKRDSTAASILRAAIWPSLLLLASALALVYFGVRFALRPLDTLGAAIARRPATDLSPVPDVAIPAETRPLVTAINRLMANLRQASRAQQVFLSNAAHQLRTPLAGLQTQLELTAQQLPGEVRPRLQRLQDAVQRLIHFINQMLALARSSKEAAAAAELQAVALGGLLEDCASQFLDAALAKGIDLGFEPAPARVLGSPWMLRELLANLVDNAIAYTPPGGRVTVRCANGAGRVLLEVEDDGPGIDAAEREKVVERFYRAAGTTGEGSGLGLAIVREVAERHDARLTLAPGPQGRGTLARVSFPPLAEALSGN